ncbi:MAG: hypothetical protein RJB66_1692 [Pseudomonadota bacterium]|jgi:beta-phosphoglucomutase-like phosphatase (HAD superfamily)
MKQIKALLFDMDGVLIDAKDWHYEALNKALGLFGHQISRYDHLVTFDGLPTKKKLEMLTKERGFPPGLHKFVNKLKQEYTIELIHKFCKPVFAHQYALSHLKRKGFKIAVCSNSIRQTIDLMMQKSNLNNFIDLIVSNEDVKNPKPNPEIYLQAMNYFGVAPTESLIFEDNQHGIEAANKSGGYLFKVGTPKDIEFHSILKKIEEIEGL